MDKTEIKVLNENGELIKSISRLVYYKQGRPFVTYQKREKTVYEYPNKVIFGYLKSGVEYNIQE